jgi:hypothetical protein
LQKRLPQSNRIVGPAQIDDNQHFNNKSFPLIAVMVVAFGSLPAGAGFAWIDRASRREVGRLPSSVPGNPQAGQEKIALRARVRAAS